VSTVAFLGPSLDWAQARRIAPDIELLPPARQGDIFSALQGRPSVLCLIDGVFDAVPSVWHHELRAALDAGVTVLGASSMGALRAAELQSFGMQPVGEVATRYASGALNDDDDVALLHGPADMGFRPLTVPHVTVLDVAQKLTDPDAAKALVALSKATPWRKRTWRQLEAALGIDTRALRKKPDVKARDAMACLKLAKRLSRRRRTEGRATTMAAAPRAVLLRQSAAANVDCAEAATTLLLAQVAKRAGLKPHQDDVREATSEFAHLDVSTATRWAEAVALERAALTQLALVSGGHVSAAEARALAAARRPTRRR
jgi:hypothetical protein